MKKLFIYGLVLMLMLSFGFAAIPTPISHWGFDEDTGTTAADGIGSLNFTLSNSGAWNTGACVIGACVNSTSSGYNLQTGGNLGITGAAARTFMFWGATNANSSADDFYLFYGTDSAGTRYTLGSQSSREVRFYGGSLAYDYNTNATFTNGWQHYTLVYNGTDLLMYVNATLISTFTTSLNTADALITLFDYTAGGFPYLNAGMDELTIWDEALTQSDIQSVFNSENSGSAYPWISGASDTLTVTAQNTYDNSTINNFNVTIEGNSTVFTTNNGTVYINITEVGGDINQTQNVTVIGNYSWPSVYTGWNISQTLVANLTESEIKFDLFEIVTNASLEGYIYDNYSNQTNGTSFDFSYGVHTVLINDVDGHFDLNFTFNVTRQQNATLNVNDIYDALLKINATDSQTGVDINVFNITLRGLNNSLDSFGTTSSGDLYLGVKKDLNYTAYVNDTLHAVTESNVTANETYTNLTIEISSVNSVLMTFIDEFTNTLISGVNMTALFVGVNSYTYTTADGTIFAELITPSDYEIRYYSTNVDDYKLRSYFFTLTNLSFNNLTLYSLNTSSTEFTKATISFQILDTSFAPVENAKVVVQRYYATENGFVSVWERLTNNEGAAVGEFETIDAFYRYLVYYGDNLEYASSTNGIQFSGDDTLTIYIDTSQDYSQGIVDIRGLKDVSNLEFQSTGNFTGFFELNYTNDNLIQICLRVSTMTDLISLECQTSASGTIQSTISAPTTRTSSYFAEALGYDTNTGRLISFDSETHTFNFDELISQNSGLKSSATFVVIIILVALALILIKYPVISIIVQTVFFSIVTLSPLPLVVGGIETTIAWLVTLTITGVYILMRGKDG